jgi:hypothetical protein
VKHNVAEPKKKRDAVASEVAIAGFEQMLYWISADQTTFELKKFRNALPAPPEEPEDSVLFFASRSGERGAYHALLAWRVKKNDKIELRLEYERGARRHEPDEREPFAEELVPWLGQFFKSEEVTCHRHARFKYPLDKCETRFPLSLASAPPVEAELYGVTFRLPTKPHDASSVRLTRDKKHWYAEVVGESRISFATYSLESDASSAVRVLDLFLQESAT